MFNRVLNTPMLTQLVDLNLNPNPLAHFASNINYLFLPIDYQFQMKKMIDPMILLILKKQKT